MSHDHQVDSVAYAHSVLSEELIKVPIKRLMYGEWLADECENCHTKENVTKFVDVSGKWKGPIYICNRCFYDGGYGPKNLREWTPEDK